MKRVDLTYFRPSGRYYSAGEYRTVCTTLEGIVAEVAQAQAEGGLPGFTNGASQECYVLIQPDEGVPHLLYPLVHYVDQH